MKNLKGSSKTNNREAKTSPTNQFTYLEKILKTRLITDVQEICQILDLPQTQVPTSPFPLLLPKSMIPRIAKGTFEDPVLLQFLPSFQEFDYKEGFDADPLQEHQSILSSSTNDKGYQFPQCLLKKYYGRALVITTNECAGHCRFCFRRFFPKNNSLFPRDISNLYDGTENIESQIQTYLSSTLSPITSDPTISELIFSGGDPLTLPNEVLKTLIHYTRNLSNVKRVRFHTRVPILAPNRIDNTFPSLQEYLPSSKSPFVLHITLHINTPNEIDDSVAEAILCLRRLGYVLTSQTVLLKGINDSTEILSALYQKLIDLGVIPYYLHQLDRVQGAAHFEVPISKGIKIVKELTTKLPGYAIPKYARELPGFPMKLNLLSESKSNMESL